MNIIEKRQHTEEENLWRGCEVEVIATKKKGVVVSYCDFSEYTLIVEFKNGIRDSYHPLELINLTPKPDVYSDFDLSHISRKERRELWKLWKGHK